MSIPVEYIDVEPQENLKENPFRRYTEYKMNSALSLPSAVHGHSLLVEFMKDWFLSNFDKDYFKTVYINGKHVMDDYLKRSKLSHLKVEKPALAITPIVNREYDRELLDSYMGGINSALCNFNYNTSFFRDYENNIFLSFNFKEIEMAFNFKVRVDTRAQQEDLYEVMKLRMRIGYTHKFSLSTDFHIPYSLILNIAYNAGFEVSNNSEIKDIVAFLSYLNKHSIFPISYKLRSINGRNEFFMRVGNVYAWLDTRNNLSADDGEREGKINTNYHIELETVARMTVPHFYVYKTAKKIVADIPTVDNDSGIGLYYISYFELPDTNDKGWNKYLSTTYVVDEIDKINPISIEMESLFNSETLKSVIEFSKKIDISPDVFIEIKCANNGEYINGKMDWKKYVYNLQTATNSYETIIGIYVNNEYVNTQLALIKQINTSRLD